MALRDWCALVDDDVDVDAVVAVAAPVAGLPPDNSSSRVHLVGPLPRRRPLTATLVASLALAVVAIDDVVVA